MKIAKIETFYVPPRWLFVRVESDEGAVGWGEASLEGWAEAVDGAFEALRDRFIGHDPFRIEDIWQIGYRGGFYRGGAVLMSALAGLEQALWDLKGRVVGLPAWEMLGGRVRDKVRAYAWIGGDRPNEIGDAAKARREQGFSAVKMNATAELGWIGTPKIFDEVVERVQAAQAQGMDVGLDFHGRVHRPLAKQLANVMGIDVCSIYLFDRNTGNLTLRSTHGLDPGTIGHVTVRLGEGATGWAAQQGQPAPQTQDLEQRLPGDWRGAGRYPGRVLCRAESAQPGDAE